MNTVAIMGRLVKDPELRQTPNGVNVTAFTVAVDRPMQKDKTDFLDCVAWRNTAEFVAKYFAKGQRIALTGQIETRTWEDKNGNKRKSVEVVANQVFFVEKKQELRPVEVETPFENGMDFATEEPDLPF